MRGAVVMCIAAMSAGVADVFAALAGSRAHPLRAALSPLGALAIVTAVVGLAVAVGAWILARFWMGERFARISVTIVAAFFALCLAFEVLAGQQIWRGTDALGALCALLGIGVAALAWSPSARAWFDRRSIGH